MPLPTPAEIHGRWRGERQIDGMPDLGAVVGAPMILPPSAFLGIPDQIRPGDMTVVPDLAAPDAGEKGLGAVAVNPVQALSLPVVDPTHLIPPMQRVP
jgi:hypothetical protein